MAPVTSSPSKPQSHLLDIPTDEELQRGRKRRRSSATPPAHVTSNGSTNLRGRGRRRSASQSNSFTRSSLEGRARSVSPKRKSPGKKYQKKLTDLRTRFEKKRRSQSPSRSRSNGGKGEGTPKPRRRQRTHSRTRSHGKNKESQKTEAGDGTSGGKEVSELASTE
ncbi:hypothetical protein L207DRAFT_153740 [Hyaloscypha variabilis F]|jgi:hypothetical protein|uniref:Uncharacterized protein n=1 Tax=Hyaloscypha variabilis (strain UAMH 11265 / GT02V1 / F) TaxID=1149755 RepID=A0A2J6S976_HYAVF|nr:hypothetical protein L207DRAFT_153740 [Hyaloscypha variabilis F]